MAKGEEILSFLRYHDEIVTRVVQGMLLEIEPVDENSAEGLISALNRVTVMGEKTDTLFSDAGARSGYIQKRFASRSSSIAALMFHEGMLRDSGCY